MKCLRTALFSALVLLAFPGCGTTSSGRPDLGAVNTPTVSGDPCKFADWFEIGRVDGLNGITFSASSYVGRCKSLGTAIDQELYTAGWERGLIDYCTPDRGYDAGRSGESYGGVCPKNVETVFLKRFKVGSEIADLERKNARLESEVNSKQDELDSILKDALQRLPSSVSKKATVEGEIQKLRETVTQNETQIRELEKKSL